MKNLDRKLRPVTRTLNCAALDTRASSPCAEPRLDRPSGSSLIQRISRLPRLAALCTLVFALPAGALRAGTWIEGPGDAGDLPTTAQVTTGIGVLDAISGRLNSSFADIDMFAILIPDPAAFSATTISPRTELFDTQLLLFDSQGLGVIVNDDTDGLAGEFHATIPLGSVTAAGLYFLAIGLPFDVALSANGSIFPDAPWGDALLGPTGAGGGLRLTGWDTSIRLTDPFDSEVYEIRLTGAQFVQAAAPVPEPSSVVTFALLAACGAASGGFRRQRGQGHLPRLTGPSG